MPREPAPRPFAPGATAPLPSDGPTVPQRALAAKPTEGGWVGQVIGGKYVVESILGRGGMGLVLKARHLRLDEPVAIKVLHKTLAKDPTMSARLLREARAALRLQSDHTVRMLDADLLDDGTPYLVLELLVGTDLATLCKKRGSPMSAEQAVAIADQMCRALAEAHALGIVHRDVKPANLFIVKRPDGRRIVKLLDFGVSRLTQSREVPVTRPGDIIGSPRYMSPEQVLAGEIDGRSDLWSAGVVLYELLSGRSPFRAEHFALACQSIVKDTPVALGVHRPDLPAGLTAVVARCLEKDPAKRFPDAGALREALAPFGPVGKGIGTQSALPDISIAFSEEPISKIQSAAEAGAFALAVSKAGAPATAPDEGAPARDDTTLVRGAGSAKGPESGAVAGSERSSVGPESGAVVSSRDGGPESGDVVSSRGAGPESGSPAASEGGFHEASETGLLDGAASPRRRAFLPMALAGLALGVAVGVGVLSWGSGTSQAAAGAGTAPQDSQVEVSPPSPDVPVTGTLGAPGAPGATGTLGAPGAPGATGGLPTAAPQAGGLVLPPASADVEPSLEPPSAKSAHPAASTSARSKPRAPVDPFGQLRR